MGRGKDHTPVLRQREIFPNQIRPVIIMLGQEDGHGLLRFIEHDMHRTEIVELMPVCGVETKQAEPLLMHPGQPRRQSADGEDDIVLQKSQRADGGFTPTI